MSHALLRWDLAVRCRVKRHRPQLILGAAAVVFVRVDGAAAQEGCCAVACVKVAVGRALDAKGGRDGHFQATVINNRDSVENSSSFGGCSDLSSSLMGDFTMKLVDGQRQGFVVVQPVCRERADGEAWRAMDSRCPILSRAQMENTIYTKDERDATKRVVAWCGRCLGPEISRGGGGFFVGVDTTATLLRWEVCSPARPYGEVLIFVRLPLCASPVQKRDRDRAVYKAACCGFGKAMLLSAKR